MLPRARDYQQVTRQIVQRLNRPPGGPDEPIEILLHAAADLLGIVGSCWHHTDPDSGLPTSNSALGHPAGTLEWSLVYEFRRPDLNLFEDLRSRRSPVAAISTATRGRLNASARFREMIAPSGVADELRVSFTDPFGVWAALVIFTDRTLNEDDLEFVSGLVPTIAGALRAAAVSSVRSFSVTGPPSTATTADDHDGPSVLILNRDDRIVSADSAARRRLALLPEPRPVELPGLISFVSAQARWGIGGRASTARMRTTDGRWFLVSASVLGDEATGDVAVVMQPAPAATVLDSALRALGLSSREREVAALAQRGHSAKGIASVLMISPWTVQDHLKSIYGKTGIGSRTELVSLVPAG